MTDRTEVHVACPHGPVATFVESGVKGVWIINVRGAERVTYPDGVTRWHYAMRCDRCRVNVPVVNPEHYGPILDRLADLGMAEVSLDFMAAAFGAPGKLPS